jgi:signal transduction histidine kinase
MAPCADAWQAEIRAPMNAPHAAARTDVARQGWQAWALIALAAGLAALGVWLPWNSVLPEPDATGALQLAAHGLAAALWIAGAILSYRVAPNSPMWRLLLAYTIVDWLVWDLQNVDSIWAFDLGNTYIGVATAVLVQVLVAFPTGRITRRGDRRLVAGVYAYALVTATLSRITDDSLWGSPWPEQLQPFFLWKFDVLHDAVNRFSAVATPTIGLVVVLAVVRHWRAARPAQRRVLVPAVLALPFVYVPSVVAYVGDNLGSRAMQDFGRSPIFLLMLAATPFLLIVGVARSRLGRGRVADLLVELGRGVPIGGLRVLLARAVGDPTLELAFPSGTDAFVDGDGQAIELPLPGAERAVSRIEADGRILAIILHDPAVELESPGIVGAVGSAARLALENERLAAEVRAQLEEVRASRARIAEAADGERRKVERDLHDGAQQRLVAITMRLEQARDSADGSARLIDETTAELRAAIAEVRQLARGMHPAILTESGLGAAAESLAERTPLPVTLDLPTARFPAPVEAAAYYVVSEALTNAVKHAGATSVTVEGSVVDGRLEVTIGDDGVGGANPAGGTGLIGLRDRVAAVNGSLEVDSPAGRGTRLRAVFPLP